MDREQALELAGQAGFHVREYSRHGVPEDEIALNEGFHTEEIIALILLVEQVTLERAAKVCDEAGHHASILDDEIFAHRLADAIRALKTNQE